MHTKDRFRAGLAILLATFAFGLGAARAQQVAPPSMPDEVFTRGDKGMLVAEVQFAADGSVATCRIVRSNVPYPLESSTVDYIRRKWVNKWLAGYTLRVPLMFEDLPWYARHWDDGMVAPPNFLPAGDPGRKLKLRVTFGFDGWVKRVQLQAASGLDSVDRETAIWVKVHWHNEAFAGKTLDAPFIFKTPTTPKSTALSSPLKPSLKMKVQPAATPNESAPPAMRVQ